MIRGEDPVVFEADFGMLGSVVSWEGSFARFPATSPATGRNFWWSPPTTPAIRCHLPPISSSA